MMGPLRLTENSMEQTCVCHNVVQEGQRERVDEGHGKVGEEHFIHENDPNCGNKVEEEIRSSGHGGRRRHL